jgi:hypothetical protein
VHRLGGLLHRIRNKSSRLSALPIVDSQRRRMEMSIGAVARQCRQWLVNVAGASDIFGVVIGDL